MDHGKHPARPEWPLDESWCTARPILVHCESQWKPETGTTVVSIKKPQVVHFLNEYVNYHQNHKTKCLD